ncbi:unnamed protein product [Prunus armeniaca]
MGDGPISALIINAYGEALNDDAKQNPQKQKNAYLSANNYMRSTIRCLSLTPVQQNGHTSTHSGGHQNKLSNIITRRQLLRQQIYSLKTKLVQIPDFDAKKPRGLNEASARMITKILASNELTLEYAQTMKYLICHDTTNFKLTENRECPQQANNS